MYNIFLKAWDSDEFSSLDQLYYEVASTYFARCDAYDTRVCTAKSRYTGEPMPANAWELGMINRNAHQVIADLAKAYFITREAVFGAIRDYARYER